MPHVYRFAAAKQWSAGLVERADPDALAMSGVLAPLAPYALPPRVFATEGAAAPAAAPDGEALWHDGGGHLLRLMPDDDAPLALPAPVAIANAARLVATRTNLWTGTHAPAAVQCFDREHLTRRFVVELPYAELRDLASDGQDGVWVLAGSGAAWHCLRVDCAGTLRDDFALHDTPDPTRLTFLRNAGLVVLARDDAELRWFSPDDGAAKLALALARIRPCFTVTALGSDHRARVIAAGIDARVMGGGAHAVLVDSDGNHLGGVDLPAPPTGADATRTALLVTTAQGLLRYTAPGALDPLSAPASCGFVTPALHSPQTADPRRWLRVEAIAALPRGTALEVSYASTADAQVRDAAARIVADASLPMSRRLARLRDHLRDWKTPLTITGSDATAMLTSMPLAAPLFDVRDPYLWVSVRLVAAAGATLPTLHELRVLYPGRTLMEYLPAIYQRSEAEPGNFLRPLVGVLETTTQALDATIARLGERIDPDTAPREWLDYVARWLGLPWDDALGDAQKRALLRNANALASMRGTRAGLETLLACLIPGTPPRFRVVDFTHDHGFAILGGQRSVGSALPTLVAGLRSSALALNRKAVLGRGRLPCAAWPDDGISRLTGQIAIDVVATAAERRMWEPWLLALVHAMVPATARIALRFASPATRLGGERLDGSFALTDAPLPHLGTDAVTGLAQLPAESGAHLPEAGIDGEIRLR